MVRWLSPFLHLRNAFGIVGLLLMALVVPAPQTFAAKELLSQPNQIDASSSLSKTILISGNGPERYLMEILADAFEQRHPTISVDFFWHSHAKPIRTVELGEADIAVTGEEVQSFRSTMIARDGIAVLTNFSNPVKELTSSQLAEIFSGKLRYWSQVYEEAPQTKIVLVNRSTNQNIRQSFEQQLKISNGISPSAIQAESEKEAITTVSGNLEAITFVSITPALRAKEDGVAINLLFIDRIEPEVQTVLDKRYPLQRPVMLVTNQQPSAEVLAFEQFVVSPEGQRLIKNGHFYPLSDR
ncbi:MAG: substrate-binding domain-containing protein [Nitrospirota bacterium]|nr:substrate-binding domain-containing protein [Nitrospirota bacterium]